MLTNSNSNFCTIIKLFQVQFMLLMSWTTRQSRHTIWSFEQQIASRGCLQKHHYQYQSQVIFCRPKTQSEPRGQPTFPVFNFHSDVNDNPPTFQQDNYEVTVSEAAPFGSVILTVMARDEDGPGKVARKKLFLIFYLCSLHISCFIFSV